MKKIAILFGFILLLSLSVVAQTLTHKQLIVNSGGGKTGSGNYICQILTGQTASGKSSDGEYSGEAGFVIDLDIPTDIDDMYEYKIEFELKQNYPNPFNPSTTIEYNLPSSGFITIAVYNILGQHIHTLVSENKAAGMYQAVWNGDDQDGKSVSSGIYMYRITTEKQVVTKKMMFLK